MLSFVHGPVKRLDVFLPCYRSLPHAVSMKRLCICYVLLLSYTAFARNLQYARDITAVRA